MQVSSSKSKLSKRKFLIVFTFDLLKTHFSGCRVSIADSVLLEELPTLRNVPIPAIEQPVSGFNFCSFFCFFLRVFPENH